MSSGAGRSSVGPLMLIGGAEDKLGSKTILGRFVELAGGPDSHIVVISTASSLGDSVTDVYRRLFDELGGGDVRGLRPLTREQAKRPEMLEAVQDATGIFLTGGNQVRLATVVGGTKLGWAILEAHRSGAVVGGTSAGASALSSHMVAFGASGDIPKQRMGQLSAGLGLLPNVIVDQHFGKRNRVGRLLSLVAHSPSQLGVGVDEDTAALITDGAVLEVLGKGTVLIVDGADLESNVYEAKRHDQLMVSGAVLHVLTAGYRFDLAERRLLPVPEPAHVLPFPGEIGALTARRIAAEGADPAVVRRSRRAKEARERRLDE